VADEQIEGVPEGLAGPELARAALDAALARRKVPPRRRAVGDGGSGGRRLRGYSGPGPDPRDPQLFGTLLAKLVKTRGWQKPAAEARIFGEWAKVFGAKRRSQVGPFFGWLDAWLKPYPDTMNLKTQVHLRDDGVRPYIELEPTSHPLSVEQRTGISVDRVAEIYSAIVHASDA